ncbi:N-acetyltransferase family protein, partial [Arthrobacter sp. AL08]|uniref:GNAT family N-acetyltransferase n=1 Tax=unclassified Arthrobacter TaxID=235627 RepID=UPI00249CE952
ERFNTSRLPDHRLVAETADGQILGWTAVSPVSGRPAYSGVVEHSVYIAAAARGQGLGTALLRALAASTEADGIWTIQASIFPENEASLRLHLTNGYVVVGRRRRIARMTHGPLTGQWRDTILIERRSPSI